jgi:hypothetical protein
MYDVSGAREGASEAGSNYVQMFKGGDNADRMQHVGLGHSSLNGVSRSRGTSGELGMNGLLTLRSPFAKREIGLPGIAPPGPQAVRRSRIQNQDRARLWINSPFKCQTPQLETESIRSDIEGINHTIQLSEVLEIEIEVYIDNCDAFLIDRTFSINRNFW